MPKSHIVCGRCQKCLFLVCGSICVNMTSLLTENSSLSTVLIGREEHGGHHNTQLRPKMEHGWSIRGDRGRIWQAISPLDCCFFNAQVTIVDVFLILVRRMYVHHTPAALHSRAHTHTQQRSPVSYFTLEAGEMGRTTA